MKKIGSNMEVENKKGIGLMALVAIIVSGAIGGGVFNLSNDLANGATPGGVVISWLFIGFGILMLVLSLNHLVVNKPVFQIMPAQDLVILPDSYQAGVTGCLLGQVTWLSLS